MKNLILKIVQSSGAKIYAMLLGVITLSITAHYLGPHGRGVIATVTTWAYLVAQAGNLSFHSVAYYQAGDKRKTGWLSETLGTFFTHTLIVTIISWILIGTLYAASELWGGISVFKGIPLFALLIGLVLIPFLIMEPYMEALLSIENRLNSFNKSNMTGSTVNVLLIIALVVISGFGILSVLFSKLIWLSITITGSLRKLFSQLKTPLRFNPKQYKMMTTHGAKMHLNIMGALMVTNIDIVMVNSYLGADQTGIYQLAVQFVDMMMIISYAAMTVLQGEASRRGVHGVWPFQKKIIFLTTGALVIATVVLSYTAKWWLIWFAGEQFAPSVGIFQMLVLSVIPFTLKAIMMSVQWIARGWFLQLSLFSILTGVVNIGLNAYLIPKFGVYGAVAATLLTATLVFLMNVIAFLYVEYDVERHIHNADLQQENDNENTDSPIVYPGSR